MEFLESSHTYLNDYGIIIPSVTQLLEWKFGFGYEDVPPEILKAKAEYGTRIHAIIEDFNNGNDPICNDDFEKYSLLSYKQLAAKLPKVASSERKVCFDNRLAGTIDITYENGELGDIKTYATLDKEKKEKAEWQLSFYYLCDGVKKDVAHLLHIPKDMKYSKTELKMHSFEECIAILEEYEACH